MSRHGYPARVVAADILRAGAGLALAGAPLVLLNLSWPLAFVLAAIALVFALFAVATARRALTRVHMDDRGLEVVGLGRQTLSWSELRFFRLCYFSTRRDGAQGWIQLTVGAPSIRLSVDSRIAGFDRLASRAFAAASRNGISLDGPTCVNLRALGLLEPDAGGETVS